MSALKSGVTASLAAGRFPKVLAPCGVSTSRSRNLVSICIKSVVSLTIIFRYTGTGSFFFFLNKLPVLVTIRSLDRNRLCIIAAIALLIDYSYLISRVPVPVPQRFFAAPDPRPFFIIILLSGIIRLRTGSSTFLMCVFVRF
jgi:hypothetical protein